MKLLTLVTMVATSAWAQYHVRRDGVPIIFGAEGDKEMAKSSGRLVVTPRRHGQNGQPQRQTSQQQQQSLFQLGQSQASLDQFTTPVLSAPFGVAPASSLCDSLSKPLVDEIEGGRAYHLSWCHDAGRTYTWEQATHYCAALGNGFQAVSVETAQKQEFITRIILAHYITDIWTSGNKINTPSWIWLSGIQFSYTNWSRTGRKGVPQPDNTDGNEDCLAVLNNNFNDGVTWHDSSCFMFRRVICEAPQFYRA
ncbi:uncharacterized protein [Procambarus clarkii]|uniref:uncharacterized protein n=1 Tax=Procambarus clarkii TaxID=6728 RepID=UPI003742BB32